MGATLRKDLSHTGGDGSSGGGARDAAPRTKDWQELGSHIVPWRLHGLTAIPFDNTYAKLPDDFFARVHPASVPAPGLFALNRPLAVELGLDPQWLASPDGVAMLSGNALPPSAEPIAMAYAGHQFGGWSPQLGDGRAVLIGELVGKDGVRRDVQLKGAGRTPFSRGGDGKSPIGPVVREYLVSEAMFALGIPTTRALAAVSTGEVVQREQPAPGGVLTRVAQSHVRVGTFQYFQGRGDDASLRRLADFVIDRHYPEARSTANPYRALLEGVLARQVELVARWMQVGFIHGVMNTDNMQIAGETIDFGPCAFMEEFDAGQVFSSIDRQGRYAWGNQPGIAQWNLYRLAEALLPLLAEDEEQAVEEAKAALEGFGAAFDATYLQGFRRKLGKPPVEGADPDALERANAELGDLLGLLTNQHVDFTRFFRELTRIAGGVEPEGERWLSLFDDPAAGRAWLASWRASLGPSGVPDAAGLDGMRRSNPIFIPRNHRVEEAIQGALRGDFEPFERLHAVLARPFEEQPEHVEYEEPARPEERVDRTFCGT